MVRPALWMVTMPASSPALSDAALSFNQRRIFFGHQSVGANILGGLAELGVKSQRYQGQLVEPGFYEVSIGRNQEPRSKLRHFEELVAQGVGDRADVAFFKFCYVDFESATDAAELFSEYQAAQAALAARYPRTVFVHVTVPLTTVQRGAKAWVKHLLGRASAGEGENVRRSQFNTLMRKAYAGREPVFDLAALEATPADGTPEEFERDGQRWPALWPGYTDDGGHLNAAGRAKVARELLLFLARLPPKTL